MVRRRPVFLLVTCEHADRWVPARYRELFRGEESILETHRGYDPGAWRLTQRFAQALGVTPLRSRVSRLLVEANRSLHHPQLFSRFSRDLSASERQLILQKYYHPHRSQVESTVAEAVQQGHCVYHVGVHSFTPILDGKVRTAEIGLLYDPRRKSEKTWVDRWLPELTGKLPSYRIRRNYPYLGTADGLTTYLRRRFPANAYAGLELEINQRLLVGPPASSRALRQLAQALASTLTRSLHGPTGQSAAS